MICFGNAAGGFIPPAFVFPLKKVNRQSMNNSIPGSIAFANGTGWFDGKIMVDVIEHLQRYVKSSKENPVLIIWDNFTAHLDYLVVKKAKEYGMEIITLPPHTSHELQPLDVSVFVALKKYIKAAHMIWYRNNPGKRITIHEVAGLTREPFYNAMTPTNLISGFKRAGIYPFIMFQPDDPRFSSSLVTDLPGTKQASYIVFIVIFFNNQRKFLFFTLLSLATSQQQIAEALFVDEMQTPIHSMEIEVSNNIHTVEREDNGMDITQEEVNVPTIDCRVFGSTVASTQAENFQPMPNNASEIVDGVDGVNQERAGNCETSGSTNVRVKRVRLEEIMPIPKVIQIGPRQKNRTRIGRSRVLTDPEEMNQLQLDYLKKQEKEQNKEKFKKTRSAKPLLSNKENISGKGKLVAGKSNMNSLPEKEPLQKTRSANTRLSNKENIPVAEKSYMNSVPEKEPLKKTRSANPRLSNNENIPEKGKLVAGKDNLTSVHEKEPLVVLSRQPRIAKKPAFLAQNYLFD
jgi:hypothetical protein